MYKFFFKITNSEKTWCKILVASVSIFLALCFVALTPVQTYAASLLSAAAGMLAGALAGIGLSVAGAQALLIVIGSIGIQISVTLLVECLTNKDFNDTATQNVVSILNDVGKNMKDKLVLSGAGLLAVYSWIKEHIVNAFNKTETTEIEYRGNALYNGPVIENESRCGGYGKHYWEFYTPYVIGYGEVGDPFNVSFSYTNPDTSYIFDYSVHVENYDGWRVSDHVASDSQNILTFKGVTQGFKCTPAVIKPLIWINPSTGNSELMFLTYDNFDTTSSMLGGSCFYGDSFNLNGSNIKFSASEVITSDGSFHYSFYDTKEKILISTFDSINHFFFYLFCREGVLYRTLEKPLNTSDVSENDKVSSTTGTATKTTVTNDYYKTKNDILHETYTNTKAAADTGAITGDVTLTYTDSASSSDAIVDVGSVAVTDCAVITDVESTVADSSGTVVDVPPGVRVKTGINLVVSAYQGIKDKFPFSIVTTFKSIFNQLNASPRTPNFSFPIKIDLPVFEYEDSFEINLSKFNRIAAITRWGITILLIICLIFATKQMLF